MVESGIQESEKKKKPDLIFMGISSRSWAEMCRWCSVVSRAAWEVLQMWHFRPYVTFSMRSKRPTTCDVNGHIAKKRLRTRWQVSCCSQIRENVKISQAVNSASHVCCYRTCNKREKVSDSQSQQGIVLLKEVIVPHLVLKKYTILVFASHRQWTHAELVESSWYARALLIKIGCNIILLYSHRSPKSQIFFGISN
jgi:hypothetical protein